MSALADGFTDAVFDSQRAFKAVMNALARPGRIIACGDGVPVDAPLPPAAAAMLLALCDHETPLFLGASLTDDYRVADYLRFRTGATLTAAASRAMFAVVDGRRDPVDLDSFAQGSPDDPDRSTTLIALCQSLLSGTPRLIAGPGIKGVAALTVSPLPDGFADQWEVNRAGFPRGVDVIFAAGTDIVALPRSARLLNEKP